MENTDASSTPNRAALLKQSRENEKARFMVTFGMLFTAIWFGSIIALIYSEEHKWIADNLYTLVLAVNNSTNIQEITFNYTRVIDGTTMELLLTDVLPYVRKTELQYCSIYLIYLIISNIVLLILGIAFILFTAASEITRFKGVRRSPYRYRAVRTGFFSSLGFLNGCFVAGVIAYANSSTLNGWDYTTMCLLGGSSVATLGAFVAQAVPEKGGDGNISYNSFAVDKLFFLCTFLWIGVSIISGIIFCKSTATTETAFIVALQELRGVMDSGSLYNDIITPAAWATLQSDVLPYVSGDDLEIHLSTMNIVLSLVDILLTVLSLACFLCSVAFRLALKIVPKKRNLSVLISLAVGLVVAAALFAVFFVLVSAREEESSWYHLMSDYYAVVIPSASLAIFSIIGAGIPCRRGEDAVQLSDSEAAGPAVELRAVLPHVPAGTCPRGSITPLEEMTTTIQVLDLGQGAGFCSGSTIEVNLRMGFLSGSTLNSDNVSSDGVSLAPLNAKPERGSAELAHQE
ncbi:hypothetical protein MMC11_002607 [Xylographa trunciseda]|nr:hypothetical protein [Xylographa trunciseda]